MENFNTVPDKGTFGGSVEVINQNFLLAQQEMEMLRQIYNSLSQSKAIPVTHLPATGEAGKIYRLAGTNSYSDYMYAESDLTTPIKMAEYDNAIDDEPTAGSDNLVKSGGVYRRFIPDVAVVNGKILDQYGNEHSTSVSSFACTDYFFAIPNITINAVHPVSTYAYSYICFYNANKEFVGVLKGSSTTTFNFTLTSELIPESSVYFRANINPSSYTMLIPAEPNYAKILLEYSYNYRIDPNIKMVEHAMLKNDGKVTVYPTWDDKYVTDYFPVGEGLSIYGLLIANSGAAANVALCFYDASFNFISYVSKAATVKDLTLTAADIPAGAVYGRSPVDASGRVLIPKNLQRIYNEIPVKLAEINTVTYNQFTVMDSFGNIASTPVSDYKTCNYCLVCEQLKLVNLHRTLTYDNIYLWFYDKYFNAISSLSSTTAISDLVLDSNNIPSGAVYFRATFTDSGYVSNYTSKLLNESDVIDLKTTNNYFSNIMFNYEAVLHINKNELRTMIESASNGRCTVIYDNEGYPSLMYKIPKVSIGALAPSLGGLTDVHPAFVVNGIEKDYIYMSVFMTSVYNNHYVSWFGLPSNGGVTVPNLRTSIANKGNGWHLETIYERSLLALMAMNLNSPTPTGNTSRGMSHSKPWEFCQLYDNSLPGSINHQGVIGVKWVNGTQPSAWSHNKDTWGIQDVIGGFHEICDLMKLINGKIYISPDNNFFKTGDDNSTFEDSWVDTGAAFDYINNNIVLNTSVTNPMTAKYYVLKSYPEIGATAQYDTLSESLRKKLCLLLMASRLTSQDANPIFDITGRFGIANHKELCYGVFGGATEYVESGLGSQITGYPIDDNATEGHNAHSNMGSRMVYIP